NISVDEALKLSTNILQLNIDKLIEECNLNTSIKKIYLDGLKLIVTGTIIWTNKNPRYNYRENINISEDLYKIIEIKNYNYNKNIKKQLKNKKLKFNKHKKNITGYHLYLNDVRNKVRDAHPNTKIQNITKIIAKEWNYLKENDKDKY